MGGFLSLHRCVQERAEESEETTPNQPAHLNKGKEQRFSCLHLCLTPSGGQLQYTHHKNSLILMAGNTSYVLPIVHNCAHSTKPRRVAG